MSVSISSQILLCTKSYDCFSLLVIVCDEGNRVAENGVDTAIKYLSQNNMANINKRSMVALSGEPFKDARDREYLIYVGSVGPDQLPPLFSLRRAGLHDRQREPA